MYSVSIRRLLTMGVLLGALIAVWIAWRAYRSTVAFEFYEKVTPTTFSQRQRKKLALLHNECFEDVRRSKLRSFIKETHGTSSPLEEQLMNQRIESMLVSQRLTAQDSYQDVENLFLVRYHGEISGMFRCVKNDDDYTNQGTVLWDLCLATKLRGRGIGKQMIRHAIKKCREPGKVFALTVYKDEPQNIGLYQTLGFKITQPEKSPPDGFVSYGKHFMIYENETSP